MFVSINYPRLLNLLLGEAVTAKRNDAAFHEGCGLAPTDGIARAAPDPAPPVRQAQGPSRETPNSSTEGCLWTEI